MFGFLPGKYLLEGCAPSSALLDFVALKRCHRSVVTLCLSKKLSLRSLLLLFSAQIGIRRFERVRVLLFGALA